MKLSAGCLRDPTHRQQQADQSVFNILLIQGLVFQHFNPTNFLNLVVDGFGYPGVCEEKNAATFFYQFFVRPDPNPIQLTVETVLLTPFQLNFHLIVCMGYTFMFKVLDYQFMPDLSIDAPTILYVPPLIYSNGYSLEVKAILNQDLMVQKLHP